MTAHDDRDAAFFLRRWSRRKREATRAAAASAQQPDPVPSQSPATTTPAGAIPPTAAGHAPAAATSGAAEVAGTAPLPPIESLSFDSDFTAYLQPQVDETLKRQALRKLFQDPRFNVMDGLDVYIDDYSVPDPISPEIVRQLAHARSFFEPTKTRVNAQGYVEDVPPEVTVAPPDASALPAPAAAAPPLPDVESGTTVAPSAAIDGEEPGERPDGPSKR